MKLSFKPRSSQSAVNTSILKMGRSDADAVLDGVDVPRPMYAKNWILESRIHQTVKLTDGVRSTRNFVGPQVNVLRDDLRKVSYAIHIEGDDDALILTEIKDSKVGKQTLIDTGVWRADIALDKYTGDVRTLYIKGVGGGRLFLDGSEISTQDADIDFPFLGFSQLPIGHVPDGPASFLVLSYKSRLTRRVFFRKVTESGVGEERLLLPDDVIGGASFAAIGNKIIFQVNLLNELGCQPAIVSSLDGGDTLSGPDKLDLKSEAGEDVVYEPYTSAPIVDYSGMVHIPISTRFGGGVRLVDVLVEDGTATVAIERPDLGASAIARVDAFPKTVCSTRVILDDQNIPLKQDFRFGDGITDGIGVIATLLQSGKLFSSNSQSGGSSYPEKVNLNHEMLEVACYATTECYTTGFKPNIVSMDYIFLEAIEGSQPLSGELHLETWDMPLPVPQGSALLTDENTIELTIDSNGNFLPGGTTISIDPRFAKVTEVKLENERKAFVKFEKIRVEEDLRGHRIRIESRNNFYFHELDLELK